MSDPADERPKPALLLHACCAPCTTSPVERLRGEYDVTAYFYNPNIHPREEYDRRLDETRRYCEEISIPLVVGPCDVENWDKLTAGLEDEPEGGERCTVCIGMRLEQTARYAAANGFDRICTVLTVSPHKNADLVARLGEQAASRELVLFLPRDFKKKDGFRRSLELSRQHHLYRQHYCGCRYSIR